MLEIAESTKVYIYGTEKVYMIGLRLKSQRRSISIEHREYILGLIFRIIFFDTEIVE